MSRVNHLLLNKCSTYKMVEETLKKYQEKNENENTMIQDLWDVTKPVLRRTFIYAHLSHEARKISNKQPTLKCKRNRKRKTSNISC